MQGKIIDFHTHPYFDEETYIGYYKRAGERIDYKDIKPRLQGIGIEKICGSIIIKDIDKNDCLSKIKQMNNLALKMRDLLGDFYVPGYHVYAKDIDWSVKEIDRMEKEGVNLVGEIIPVSHGWDFDDEGFEEILCALDGRNKVLSFHSTSSSEKANAILEERIKRHQSVTFVAAHFGEKQFFERHLSRMEKFPNYYLDTSGTGLFRYGALSYGVSKVGKERFLMGSDFAVCEPAMYVGGIKNDALLLDEEKQAVLYDNANQLLKL